MMRLLEDSARFAYRGVVANRMRSALTMLGIVIGVASVITLVAVGTGSQEAVQASIDRLGSNTLFVLPNAPGRGGKGSELAHRVRRLLGLPPPPANATDTRAAALTYADVAALADKADVPDAIGVAPGILMQKVTAQFGAASHTIAIVIGTTPGFLSIDNSTVTVGRDFTDADYTAHRHDCLLGASVTADLTAANPAGLIGKRVRLNGQPFTVVGLLGTKGYSGQTDLDDRAICTGTAVADSIYGYAPPGQGPINAIAVEAGSAATVPATQRAVYRTLDTLHHESLANSDFLVFTASSVLSASTQSNHTLAILLAAVAGISLLVGGIGVMNIMLVSVTERTREIGIRKAVGADRADIVGQFLTEAIILSMSGGSAGIAFGLLASRFTIAGVHPAIAAYSVYLAFGVSLFTGLFFGIYPARRAAALRPIDALRYE
jgi:putative ABC transport system permease protein